MYITSYSIMMQDHISSKPLTALYYTVHTTIVFSRKTAYKAETCR